LDTASVGLAMRNIIFTEDDRRALAHYRYYHLGPRVQRKVEVLWLKSHGLGHDRIAAHADVSRRTVRRYLDEYLQGGLERLCRGPRRQPRAALIEHEVSPEEHFETHPVRSIKQARAVIEQRAGIRRGPAQVRHFPKDRLGLRWRRAGAIPVPPKKTVAGHARDQAAFLKGKLGPRLEQARRGRRQVYFVDAAHFVFAPLLGCLWCAARLFVRAASGRERHSVPGAFDAVARRLIRVTDEGYINAEPVCPLLGAVAGAAVGSPITLVLDDARYQKCAVVQALAVSLGIELLYLPSCSPDLNLIERLWRFVRKEALNSIYHEKFEDLRAAIEECPDGLSTVHRGEMETLMTHSFQLFEDEPLLAA
ncbi:MAG: IS630 family transposase, partial [Actinobacteria bacterium]|nr:IS630 family transposase [Actinomycetota bacterium]